MCAAYSSHWSKDLGSQRKGKLVQCVHLGQDSGGREGRKADLMFSPSWILNRHICVRGAEWRWIWCCSSMLKKKGLADKGVGYSYGQSFEWQWNSLCTLITNWACRGTNSSTCRVGAEWGDWSQLQPRKNLKSTWAKFSLKATNFFFFF